MVRYLGIGLGLGIGAGLCAATGTLLPPRCCQSIHQKSTPVRSKLSSRPWRARYLRHPFREPRM